MLQCPTCYGEGKIQGKQMRFLHAMPWVAIIFILIATPAIWVGYAWRDSGYPPSPDCPAMEAPSKYAVIPFKCGQLGDGPMVCPRGEERLRIVVESTGRQRTFENVIYFDRPSPLPDGGVE